MSAGARVGLDDLVGQERPVATLRRAIETGRLHHGLLFQGPEGVGKATAARALAAELILGRRPGPDDPDAARIVGGGDPDFLLVGREARKNLPEARRINPAEEDLSREITIEQVRKLCSLAAMAPRSGRRRVLAIDPADAMNRAAQNALLKTLEEPPGSAVLILVASRPHLLLPTVRSRCFQLRFGPLRSAELAELLERRGVPANEARLRAALAEGRPGAALDLDVDRLRARRDELLAHVEALAGEPRAARRALAELPSVAARLAGKDDATLAEGLDVLQSLLRDAARAGDGTAERPAELVHLDLEPRLARLGAALSPRRAAELVAGIDRMRGDLRLTVNRALLAESVLAAVAGAPWP